MGNTGVMVYVVDDDVSVCNSLSILLKAQEFRVATFTSAEGFLGFKHPKVPSCLVLDFILPNINGLALQEIMAKRGIIIPIIFITGHGSIPLTVTAMKAGAIDFLAKPFTNRDLIKAIALALARSKIQNEKQVEIARIKKRIGSLSPRELEVFHWLARGMLNKQIASKRGTSLQTIKVHRGRVMQKMQAKTVTELIRFAQIAGITSSLD